MRSLQHLQNFAAPLDWVTDKEEEEDNAAICWPEAELVVPVQHQDAETQNGMVPYLQEQKE